MKTNDSPPSENTQTAVFRFTHRDTRRDRCPKTNARKDRDQRSKLREAVRHDTSEFARSLPIDILARATVDDRQRFALELLDAVCDEPRRAMQWLREEALSAIGSVAPPNTPGVEIVPVGRSAVPWQSNFYAKIATSSQGGLLPKDTSAAHAYHRSPGQAL
jgi:hypothetical protein